MSCKFLLVHMPLSPDFKPPHKIWSMLLVLDTLFKPNDEE